MPDPKQSVQVDKTADGQIVQAVTPASPAPPPTGAKHCLDAMTWATIVNSACTLVALCIALFLGLRSLRVAEDSLRTTSESLRQNNLATIYTLGLEATQFAQAHPKLAKFIDKEVRRPMTDQELWDEYNKLPEEQQVLVYLYCEQLADFSQIAFMQRDVLPANDWDTWWSYIMDQYDESPIYRDFLSKRPTWYAFLKAIKPENRAKYYRGDQKR